MNTAITALDTIYSQVLVHECSGDVLKTFTENLNTMKREWEHKSKVQDIVETIRRDGEEAFGKRCQAANKAANAQYYMGNTSSLEHREWEIIQQASAIWEGEKAKAIAAEARITDELLRQKRKEDDIMQEARRRLDVREREMAIQAAMIELICNRTQ